MLEKIINPSDYMHDGEAGFKLWSDVSSSPSLLKQASLSKSAALDISGIKSEPGKVKIHVIALGAGEYWGANRNGDYFPEEALIKYHKTFEQFGHFHKNHKNKPTDPKYGKVELSYYNPKMKRVELIVAVDLSSYPEFKDKLRSGDDIPVSMAAKLPYDICSICGHRRTKPGREFTCKHINDEMTKIYPDGRQVFALNLKPRFFDISEVFRPADRTAYMLRKVARDESNFEEIFSSNQPKVVYEVPRLRKIALDKLSFLKKLSELEKRVEGELTGEVQDGKIKSLKKGITSQDIPDEIIDAMSELPLATSLSSLADKGIILRPREFARISLKRSFDKAPLDDMKSLVRGIFSKILNKRNLEDFYPSRDFDFEDVPEHSKVSRIFSRFIEPRTMLRAPAVKRTMIIVMAKKPEPEFKTEKESLEKESSFKTCLATTYGLYKASALKYILDREKDTSLTNNVTAISAILENYI